MLPKPPATIDEMRTLYYADLSNFQLHLKKYMKAVPRWFVLVYEPEDKTYCILGTDEGFEKWEQYTNYVFAKPEPALELPDTIFRLPDDFQWIKI